MTLVLSSPLECSDIDEVGLKKIGLLYFRSPRERQPQVLISSKPLLKHQDNHCHTFQGGRVLMLSIQFGLQWVQIVDILNALLPTLLPDGTSHLFCDIEVRMILFNIFQLVFKTVV